VSKVAGVAFLSRPRIRSIIDDDFSDSDSIQLTLVIRIGIN
jgi:hypothetical protein